eukprot:10184288-Alexandrium_andersonii.AAC.1
MSASLVGSEMCIRDSTLMADRLGRSLPGWPERIKAPVLPFRKAGSGRPVSYTHLTLPTICSV